MTSALKIGIDNKTAKIEPKVEKPRLVKQIKVPTTFEIHQRSSTVSRSSPKRSPTQKSHKRAKTKLLTKCDHSEYTSFGKYVPVKYFPNLNQTLNSFVQTAANSKIDKNQQQVSVDISMHSDLQTKGSFMNQQTDRQQKSVHDQLEPKLTPVNPLNGSIDTQMTKTVSGLSAFTHANLQRLAPIVSKSK